MMGRPAHFPLSLSAAVVPVRVQSQLNYTSIRNQLLIGLFVRYVKERTPPDG